MGCNSSAGVNAPKGKGGLVTITGISGFIGAHVCKLFLDDGNYKVRGTVRDKSNPEKLEQFKAAFGKNFDKLEIVDADLLDDESLSKAIEGSTYVVHVASPAFFGGTEEQLIKPAVQGTLGILKAC
jgi:nucleoside-diphosphate-sugar epimerase